jgi:hypothetical protein
VAGEGARVEGTKWADEWVPSAEMQRVQAACCEGQEAAAAPASLAREGFGLCIVRTWCMGMAAGHGSMCMDT